MLDLKKLLSSDKKEKNVLDKLMSLDSVLLKPEVHEQFKTDDYSNQKINLVLRSYNVAATLPELTGGKGSSLAILNTIKEVEVPNFFCVTTNAYTLQTTKFKKLIDSLENLSDDFRKSNITSQKVLNEMFQEAKRIRSEIEKEDIDSKIVKEIKEAYYELCKESKIENVPVAVRSSATTEDTKDASFAGQHDTYLGQKGENDVINSIRRCWASIFTDRAVEYRSRNNIKHIHAIMCVVVQVMVDPISAGTSFSCEISTGFPAVNIAASYGLGESVVSGEVTSDEWLVNKDDLSFIKTVIGSKKTEFVMKPNHSGTILRDVSDERRNKLCLTDDQVKKVSRITINIQKVYSVAFGYENVDTEFAIDSNPNINISNSSSQVKMLQSRPVVCLSNDDVLTVDTENIKTGSNVVKASYSLLGAVTGKCKVINNFDDLVNGVVSIGADDIVVTAKTGNYWNQYLTSLKGIVTVDGSPTAHPMLIGRERNLVVLCGIPDLMQKCQNLDGKTITIDGLSKWLYTGEQKLVKASKEKLLSRFATQQVYKVKNKSDELKFLEDYGRIIRKDNIIWIKNPNTKLSPIWSKLYASTYSERFGLVNKCRTKKLSNEENPMKDEKHCVIDGYNVDEYTTNNSNLEILFEGMTLEDAEKYCNLVDYESQRYLSACEEFEKNPTVKNWRIYVEAYKPIYAALWNSFLFRNYLKKMSTTYANKHGVTNFHYEEILRKFQEDLSQKEEDNKLHNAIVEIADEIRPKVLSEKEQRDIEESGKVMSLSEKTIINISVMNETLRNKVRKITRGFRLIKSTDISLESPFPNVVELIVQAISSCAVKQDLHDDDRRVTFFPMFPEFMKSVYLLMYSRLQNSNCHHWKIKGQWKIRNALVKIANEMKVEIGDLFKKENLEDMENLIAEYEMKNRTSLISGTKVFFSFGFITGLFFSFSLVWLFNFNRRRTKS